MLTTSVIGGLGTASVVYLRGKFVSGAGFGNAFVHADCMVDAFCVV